MTPLWPNLVRTCTTPPEGLVGQVIDGGDGRFSDLDGQVVRDRIVLLEMTPGHHWVTAAKLGAKAILFRRSASPRDYQHKILKFPGRIPRFVVDGPPEAVEGLVGREVRLECRVDWEIREARNVIGVLPSSTPSREALVLMGFTDSWSVVPDEAPGYYEACSAVSLVETARALSTQRAGLSRPAVFVASSGRGMGVEGARRLLDGIGSQGEFEVNAALVRQRLWAAEQRYQALAQARSAHVAAGKYWELELAAEERLWERFGAAARRAHGEAMASMVDRYIARLEEERGSARVAWQQGAIRPRGRCRRRSWRSSGPCVGPAGRPAPTV